MSRSKWKGPYFNLNHIFIGNKEIPVKIYSRSSMVVPAILGRLFLIYNGKKYIKVEITANMLGHKFGEFALTLAFFKYGSKKNKQKISKKINQKNNY